MTLMVLSRRKGGVWSVSSLKRREVRRLFLESLVKAQVGKWSWSVFGVEFNVQNGQRYLYSNIMLPEGSRWWINLTTLRFLDEVNLLYCFECNSQSILLMVRESHPYFSWIIFCASSSKLTSRTILSDGNWKYFPFTNIAKGADGRWFFIGFVTQEFAIVSASTFSFPAVVKSW